MRGGTVVRLLLVATALGGAVGALFAAHDLVASRYVAHGLHRLELLALRDHVWRGIGVVLPLALMSAAAGALVERARRVDDREGARKLIHLASDLVAASAVLAWFAAYAAELRSLFEVALGPALARAGEGSRHLWLSVAFGMVAAPSALILFRGVRPAARRHPSRWRLLRSGVVLGAGGGLALALALAHGVERATAAPVAGPNLVLITIDALRADHVGAWGHSRATTPRLDALMASGLRFERAVAQAPWTLPSLASIHTGLYPSEHGADRIASGLPRSAVTVAEVLRDAGYRTVGVVSHTFAGRRYGLDQGFEVFDESQSRGPDAVTSGGLTRAALEHASGTDGRPLFLWVHYFDPHWSFVRHPEFAHAASRPDLPEKLPYAWLQAISATVTPDELDYVRAVYDEEVSSTDHWIGELVDALPDVLSEALAATSAERPTVWIVVADHGEQFMERGRFGHGRDLYDELIRVPLAVFGDLGEALQAGVVEQAVETARISRTLAELAGVETELLRGPSLFDLALGVEQPEPARSEGSHARGPGGRKLGIVTEGWKLIRNLDDGSFELYDLIADPAESANRWDDADEQAQPVRDRLASLLGDAPPIPVRGSPLVLGSDELETLRPLATRD
jgi:arylsulfatase